MFGLVKSWQNGFGSPKSVVRSPSSAIESQSLEVGEIDTRAPISSVKAAVTLFGDVISPRARPVTKKTQAEEQRVLEKETQHLMILRELDYYKDQLRIAEATKSQALRDLQVANKTLQQLTNKLEHLSESKQAAIQSTEAAKNRAKELEEQKSLKAHLGNDAWKQDVDSERERYKTSAGELGAIKQELTNLRQDFDAALETKLAAFHEAEEAQHAARINQEKQNQLSKEVAILRETLDQVKLESLQAEDEHLMLSAEKEVRLLVHKSAKEVAEREMRRLKEECGLGENLEQKLEETTEAIKVLQEQLNDVRISDLCLLQNVVSELENAKRSFQEIVEEENSIRSCVEALKLEVEETNRDCSEWEKKAVEEEAKLEAMEGNLGRMKNELNEAMSRHVFEDMQSALEKLLAEAERCREEAEETNREIEILKQEEEEAKAEAKEAEEKLEAALKEAEAAKVAKQLADEQIHDSPRTDLKEGSLSGSNRRITLSVEEFDSMNKKIEEFRKEADVKVGTAMAQVKSIKASENETLGKVEAILKEIEEIESEIDDALKRAEMADAAKKIVENELQKWRQKEEDF